MGRGEADQERSMEHWSTANARLAVAVSYYLHYILRTSTERPILCFLTGYRKPTKLGQEGKEYANCDTQKLFLPQSCSAGNACPSLPSL